MSFVLQQHNGTSWSVQTAAWVVICENTGGMVLRAPNLTTNNVYTFRVLAVLKRPRMGFARGQFELERLTLHVAENDVTAKAGWCNGGHGTAVDDDKPYDGEVRRAVPQFTSGGRQSRFVCSHGLLARAHHAT